MAVQQDQQADLDVGCRESVTGPEQDHGGTACQDVEQRTAASNLLNQLVSTTSSLARIDDSSTASSPDARVYSDGHALVEDLRRPRHLLAHRNIGRLLLARDLSGATGINLSKCLELMSIFTDAMITVAHQSALHGQPFVVDGIGQWTYDEKTKDFDFLPDDAFIDGANQPPKPDTVLKRMKFTPNKSRTYRDQDVRIADEWISVRRGHIPQDITIEALFDPTFPIKNTVWSDKTGRDARVHLLQFAHYSPTPLIDVGLSLGRVPIQGTTPEAEAWRQALHLEVQIYAKAFEERTIPRLRKLYRVDEQIKDPQDPIVSQKMPTVWRTQSWARFVFFVMDFYNWCIERGYRYPGSNPLAGIQRFGIESPSKKKRVIVREWYSLCLAYPTLTPTEKIVVYLLANGLRGGEVRKLRLEHLRLSEGRIDVYGKGGKFRVVRLLPWVQAAVDEYLVARRHTASPWLFGSERSDAWPRSIVGHVANRVFAMPYQDKHRRHIRPHGFRHWHISRGIELGMDQMAMKEQAGHRHLDQTLHYVTTDTTWIDNEFAKVVNKKWF